MYNYKKSLLAVFVATVISVNAGAQTVSDLLRYSQQYYSYGTARSAAMGGAFSSLGADMSSLAINPAGLGMYRSSEVSLSPSLMINSTKTNNVDALGSFSNSSNKTKPAFNNIGIALNVYEGLGVVTSATIGFSYNKMNDYAQNKSVIGRSDISMLDAFWGQMDQAGSIMIPPSNSDFMNFGTNIDYWGGTLAYNTMLLNYYDEGGNGWHIKDLLPEEGAEIDSRWKKSITGASSQIDIGGGINLSNILYLGIGFGIQNILNKDKREYQEIPRNNEGYGLNRFTYIQQVKQEGTAWNVKFGAILSPVTGLRISGVIHSPTYISLDTWVAQDMYSYFNDFAPQYDGVETGNSIKYKMQTPARMILGASYTFAQTAILSFDWERVWYNKMKMYDNHWDFEVTDVSMFVDQNFKASNNFRVGAEVVAAPGVYVRAGYATYGSMLKNDNLEDYYKVDSYSGGLGYRNGEWGLDLSYVYMQSKELPDQVFHYEYDANTVFQSGRYTTDNKKHMITLTGSYRFSL